MKKLLVGLSLMFACAVASATTVNLNWVVDDTNYAQTTCQTGGDLILPSAPPAKYGYTFRGWTLVEEFITGTVTRNGTPTPSNPIYPTFYENNGMTLRAIGDIADSYNNLTGKITRRIGVKVLDGTEFWDNTAADHLTGYRVLRNTAFFPSETQSEQQWITSHFITGNTNVYNVANRATRYSGTTRQILFCISESIIGVTREASSTEAVNAFKQWLADQYTNGTPVTVYYPLAESVEEVWTGQ